MSARARGVVGSIPVRLRLEFYVFFSITTYYLFSIMHPFIQIVFNAFVTCFVMVSVTLSSRIAGLHPVSQLKTESFSHSVAAEAVIMQNVFGIASW